MGGGLDELLGNRVGTDNAAMESLVELEVLLVHACHVHNVSRRRET